MQQCIGLVETNGAVNCMTFSFAFCTTYESSIDAISLYPMLICVNTRLLHIRAVIEVDVQTWDCEVCIISYSSICVRRHNDETWLPNNKNEMHSQQHYSGHWCIQASHSAIFDTISWWWIGRCIEERRYLLHVVITFVQSYFSHCDRVDRRCLRHGPSCLHYLHMYMEVNFNVTLNKTSNNECACRLTTFLFSMQWCTSFLASI